MDIHIKLNLDIDLIPVAKLTQSGSYLNIRHETIELLEENLRENLGTVGFGKFLDTTPKAWSMKEKIDKLDIVKIKNFCPVKDAIKKMKRQVRLGEIFAKHISDKRHIHDMTKRLLKLNNKETKNPIKNGPKSWKCREDIPVANMHMKKCSTSLSFGSCLLKQWDHYRPIGMTKIFQKPDKYEMLIRM